MTKAIIFDAGTLISFSMNGLFAELEKLKKIFNGKFLITEEVKNEVVDKPIKIRRFELEGLRIRELLNKKILELPDSVGVSKDEVVNKTNEFLENANNIYSSRGKPVHIIDSGEASCLALSRILTEKKIIHVVAVDERTTRLLGEKPENLKKLLEQKLHIKIKTTSDDFKFFRGFRFIRSSELVYVIHKKGIMKLDGEKTLDALLWAVKFKGCSITEEEIKEILRIG
ncbi:MAG: hypothetical protein PVJ67_05460 [Candidatus Pacearchaeota archaeon]|jgi:hypothetical protein